MTLISVGAKFQPVATGAVAAAAAAAEQLGYASKSWLP
jgi:hypothetical protein